MWKVKFKRKYRLELVGKESFGMVYGISSSFTLMYPVFYLFFPFSNYFFVAPNQMICHHVSRRSWLTCFQAWYSPPKKTWMEWMRIPLPGTGACWTVGGHGWALWFHASGQRVLPHSTSRKCKDILRHNEAGGRQTDFSAYICHHVEMSSDMWTDDKLSYSRNSNSE